jgi:hypothetical protein
MQKKARILIDQAHQQAWAVKAEVAAQLNPANPADASYAKMAEAASAHDFEIALHEAGLFDSTTLENADVLVIPHASSPEWEQTIQSGSAKFTDAELAAIEAFVADGGSLLLLAETEQPKYGNNFADLAQRFGISIENATVQDPENCFNDVPTWVIPKFPTLTESDFAYKVDSVVLYRAGALSTDADASAEVFLRSSDHALPADAALGVAVKHGKGRVVVLADSDLFGDDSIEDAGNLQLWLNIVGWLSNAKAASLAGTARSASWAATDARWLKLATAIEAMRPMQAKDGSIDATEHDHAQASALLDEVLAAIDELAPDFAHQSAYFAAVKTDLNNWRANGFGVPDFYDSLELFRPDQDRKNNVQHLAVFSMYTQNGNPNRNLEAVITNTFWPDWLADKEKKYNNPAFIPIEFVAFTSGYDTNSAVFFPETVATRSVATYYWGGIFCDREAARFRRVSSAAKELLYLPLPADAERLVCDQALAQETFVLWDLIHDRTHSRGDLPFDPFMIKQRMPFWMYALEELRCDLSTFRETLVLEADGDPRAKYMRYAILFDRLFRFPITGGRVRNYDGLGGQIIFAHLHKTGALHWTDNRLAFDWDAVTREVVNLCEQVESLYHDGINRSRLAQWISAYEFVSGLVQPHPASNWAKGVEHLPTDGELKGLVNLVLDDEFPLNVFFETLNRKLSSVIESTKGITA